MRCMHEASLHDDNVFLTLTYDNEHLPPLASLRKRDFQLFMKRLRKKISPKKLRFFHSGEYGEETMRPHYHALLFGYDFPDKYQWSTRGDNPVYRSPLLESLWTLGNSELGSVTFQSASYVAQYCIKKLTGPEANERYKRLHPETGELVPVEAEYATMSRRPGIGTGFYEKYGEEIHRHDSVVINGLEVKPPKFYDQLAEQIRPQVLIKNKSMRKLNINDEENSPHRLTIRERVAERTSAFFNKEGEI
mgnify:CR=1 FL=1